MDRAQTHLAANHAEMIDALKANVRGNDIVLLKGSRKVALDTVVEAMKGFYGISKG
jgi:UDP-N-acetylmuramyl pentapeptide synthase